MNLSSFVLPRFPRKDVAFYEICKVFTTHFYAEFNEESADYLMFKFVEVKEYVYALVGKK